MGFEFHSVVNRPHPPRVLLGLIVVNHRNIGCFTKDYEIEYSINSFDYEPLPFMDRVSSARFTVPGLNSGSQEQSRFDQCGWCYVSETSTLLRSWVSDRPSRVV